MTLARPGQLLPHLDLKMFSYDDIRSMCPASISPERLIAGFLRGVIYSHSSSHRPCRSIEIALARVSSCVRVAEQCHRTRTRRGSGGHLIKLPYFTGSKTGPDKLRSKMTQLARGRQGALRIWLSNSGFKILFS